jgi:hypothetical protein
MSEPQIKKRKTNPAFAERKKRQQGRVFTCIKTGFSKLCRYDAMKALIQDTVYKSSLIACESSLLTTFHVIRLLEASQALPELDTTFFNQCVSCIANQGTARKYATRNPALMQSLTEFKTLQPQGYEPVRRQPHMSQVLVMIAQQAQENFVVSTSQTLTSRLARWFRLKIKQHSQRTDTSSFFIDNEPSIIKSIMSVLTRASTEELCSVASLVARYPRFKQDQYPIPPAEIDWMQSLCDDVRARIGPLPLQVKKTPGAYMPFLYSLLKDLEAHNSTRPPNLQGSGKKHQDPNASNDRAFKTFSLLPQKKIRPLNIKINNTVLQTMHKFLKTGVALQGRDLWSYYFETGRVTRSERKEFEEFMMTDGMSASLIVSRPKSVSKEKTTESELVRAQILFEEARRVVAVDPGRNPVITAVVHDKDAMESLQSHNPDNVKHKVIKWSKKKFYHESGCTYRGTKTTLWISKNPVIVAFNASISTAKTSSLAAYKAHAANVLTSMVAVMDFYNSSRFKRLRWKTYIKRQKAYEKLVADLKGGEEQTLIVWGDAKFAASGRGSPAVPTSSVRMKVGSRVQCLDHDEYRTSKLSCCCHTEMHGLTDPATGKRSWHLRVCQNNACPRRVWDRNVSAAINILAMFLIYVQGQPRPIPFSRGFCC